MKVVVGHANIGRHAAAGNTQRNIARMERGTGRGSFTRYLEPFFTPAQVVLWNEIDDDNAPVHERPMIVDQFADRTHQGKPYRTVPAVGNHGQKVPVTLPAAWRIVEQTATFLSKGIRRVSPDRYLVRVVVEIPKVGRVAFYSWQPIQGAFTDAGQTHEADRAADWHHGAGLITHQAAKDKAAGITVILGADTNRPKCPPVHPDEHRIVTAGLDILGYIEGDGPAAVVVKVVDKGVENLSIDGHNGPWAYLDLSTKEQQS